MTVQQFSHTDNPDSAKSCIGVVSSKHNPESGLFCVYDKRVSKKFWLKHSECFLTDNEQFLLNNVKYKKKTFGRNKKANRAATIIISLIRKFSNGKYNAQLSRDILGKLLKSNDTVDSVLNALVDGSVIENNNYSNRKQKIALKWRFTDSFTKKLYKKSMIDGFESVGLKRASVTSATNPLEDVSEEVVDTDSQKPVEELTEASSKEIEVIDCGVEFKIDFPQDSVIIFEEVATKKLNNKTMYNELTPDEEYQQKLMVSSLSPYFKKRFAQFGLDIYAKSYCDCCKEMLPNALFSVSNSGILNRKCKMCWDADDKTNTTNGKDPLEVARIVGAFAKNLRKGYSATFSK